MVEVKKGFALNYLVPNGIAEAATKKAIKQAEIRKKQIEAGRNAAKEKLSNLAQSVSGKTYRITAEVSSGGRLYGSLSSDDVKAKLKKAWKIKEDDQIEIGIDLAKPIQQSGKYPVEVSVKAGDRDDTVEIILEVVGEE